MGEQLEIIYKALLGVCVMIIGFFTRNTLESIKADVKQTQTDLAAHKLYTSENYAKEESMQTSLARIHDRIDSASEDINHKIDVISHDIKTMLTNRK